MIKIKTLNETDRGFDLELHIEGDGNIVVPELTSIFDRIYKASPMLFEAALVGCKYTEDHT
jgi:hypothetical protein